VTRLNQKEIAMPRGLALLFVIPLLASSGAQSQSGDAPHIVDDAIKQAKSGCQPERSDLKPGFLVRKDINGDGVPDYILDYEKFQCGESASYFCGTAGCLTQVFASLGGEYVKVLDDNVREIKFRTIKQRPAMILGLHGTACGKDGAAPCSMTLFWNGQKFSPAN
jgi:hypothetical protein